MAHKFFHSHTHNQGHNVSFEDRDYDNVRVRDVADIDRVRREMLGR